ncbi:excisionase family DNA binding protein [Sporomusaceae bacterium BoRhaA]|uniref:helix-turn-helix domain-containing protein n=1 Tax=Pelorhabdus rhamnosifermentans TaxID=2772457 RepID=UPI001C061330|nr:helix-turn-helix domain-containing protein [Pelorhabdus rhamnosifermentans]MBU2703198.1 excisionase family DNA binding protein [Pelorhabdus rhamnosifermentans]
MVSELKGFVENYGQVVTVAMLFDLCNAVGVKPSELIDDNAVSKKTKVLYHEIKKEAVNNREEALRDKKNEYKQNLDCLKVPKIFNNNRSLTCDEVAEYFRVQKSSVWSWIRDEKLNAIKFGNNYRIRPQDLKAFEESMFTKS